jgi:hypothetical protein
VDPLRCFRYVTPDNTRASRLRDVYRHVDRIDAFIGLMLEGPGPGVVRFPPTATVIILNQFRRTRAADRWFYLNGGNPHLAFSSAEWQRIRETVAESIYASYGIEGMDEAFRVHDGSHAFCKE